MNLRKNLLFKNLFPAIILSTVGIMAEQPIAHTIIPVLPALIIIGISIVFLIWIYRRPVEHFDEMAKKSYLEAGQFSYMICICAMAVLLIYSLLKADHVIFFSNSALCFVLAGMQIVNVAAFLFFDIKGDGNE